MSAVSISYPHLALAFVFIALAMAIVGHYQLALKRSLLWGAIRAAVQLVAIGYVLRAVFAVDQPWATAAVLTVMLLVASYTGAQRVAHGPTTKKLWLPSLVIIATAGAAALLPLFLWIVRPEPWFNPRYVIPIAGMMLSNAMNVVAQVFERLFAAAESERALIEQLLALGATPKQALATPSRAAIRAALIPTINGLATVGLVALPGMMTGQILSGAEPTEAVRYQLVIMYQLVAVAAIAAALSVTFARRQLFNDEEQLLSLANS